jgi:outer membrane biosynthesis protein TonB
MLKVTRAELETVAKEMGLKTTAKGKPLSDEALLEQIQDSMDEHSDDEGKFENVTLAKLASAAEDEVPVQVVADKKKSKEEPPAKSKKKAKPVVEDEDEDDEDEDEEEAPAPKKKASKSKEEPPAKSKKKAKPVEEDEDDEDDDDEAPAKSKKKAKADKPKKKAKEAAEPKEKAETDRFGSRKGSSAYLINQVLFKNSKKGVTAAQIHEVVATQDESITKDRVNAHLRRLHLVSGLLERDAKDRYTVVKTAE